MPKDSFVPALRFHALTPLFNAFAAVLGFGQLFLEKVARLAAPEPNQQIVDVACGTGRLLPFLTPSGARIHGVDVDEKALSIARRVTQPTSNVTIHQASITQLPFEDASIDLVISVLTFHHLDFETKKEALKEIKRVLMPGGRFLLVDFGAPENLTQKILLGIGSWADGRRNVLPHLQGKIPTLLADAGFSHRQARSNYHAVHFLECRVDF